MFTILPQQLQLPKDFRTEVGSVGDLLSSLACAVFEIADVSNEVSYRFCYLVKGQLTLAPALLARILPRRRDSRTALTAIRSVAIRQISDSAVIPCVLLHLFLKI